MCISYIFHSITAGTVAKCSVRSAPPRRPSFLALELNVKWGCATTATINSTSKNLSFQRWTPIHLDLYLFKTSSLEPIRARSACVRLMLWTAQQLVDWGSYGIMRLFPSIKQHQLVMDNLVPTGYILRCFTDMKWNHMKSLNTQKFSYIKKSLTIYM